METAGEFTKTFNIRDHMAHTLDSDEVTDIDFDDHTVSGTAYTKTHPDGWTITGSVYINYYSWVNDFEAKHPQYGWVHGNFETTVHASSETTYYEFYKSHTPRVWDYHDI